MTIPTNIIVLWVAIFIACLFFFLVRRSFNKYARGERTFCVDCKHYANGYCRNPYPPRRNLTTGELERPKVTAEEARHAINNIWCGHDARRFEALER